MCIVSHRFVSSSVLKKEETFLIANVSTILQLVVSMLVHCMATLLVRESGRKLL